MIDWLINHCELASDRDTSCLAGYDDGRLARETSHGWRQRFSGHNQEESARFILWQSPSEAAAVEMNGFRHSLSLPLRGLRRVTRFTRLRSIWNQFVQN